MTIDYASAGVNIAAGNEAVERIKSVVKTTYTPAVLSHLGSFASLYDLKSLCSAYQHPVMVQSIDGVGTKMMVAKMMQRFDTIGMDLVAATANDILVIGAKPLTLLDYIANDTLDPAVIETIVTGMSVACRDSGIALVGGETAEMPGTYLPGEHDLVGTVTGVVDKAKIIDGSTVQPGDVLYAFESSGLHTNGYSLARQLLFEHAGYTVDTMLNELPSSVGEALLEPHVNYTNPILDLLEKVTIQGMAHITGGGIIENLPRILPQGCAAIVDRNACPVPPIFRVLQSLGELTNEEAYRTFNMGMGYVLVVRSEEARVLEQCASLPVYRIGEIVAQTSGSPKIQLIEK